MENKKNENGPREDHPLRRVLYLSRVEMGFVFSGRIENAKSFEYFMTMKWSLVLLR